MAWWATRSTIAPSIGAGSRRPRPATHHTGVERERRPPRRARPSRWRRAVSWRRAPRPRRARGRRPPWRSPPTRWARARSRSRPARAAARTTTPGGRRRRRAPRTSPRRASAIPVSSGHPIVATVAPSGSSAISRSIGGVALDLVDRRAGRGHRVGARQHPGAQPPQRPARRVPLDDAPAGDDEPGRVEPEPAQRPGRLPHERLGVGAPGPGHVPQALDRMHPLTVPTAPHRTGEHVGATSALLATVAPRGDEPTDGPHAGPARCRGTARSRSG